MYCIIVKTRNNLKQFYKINTSLFIKKIYIKKIFEIILNYFIKKLFYYAKISLKRKHM